MIGALLGRFWRELSALAAAIAAVGAIYLKGRRDAARDAEREALKRRIDAGEKGVNRAACRESGIADVPAGPFVRQERVADRPPSASSIAQWLKLKIAGASVTIILPTRFSQASLRSSSWP